MIELGHYFITIFKAGEGVSAFLIPFPLLLWTIEGHGNLNGVMVVCADFNGVRLINNKCGNAGVI